MAKRKVPSLESRLIEACLRESRAWQRWERTGTGETSLNCAIRARNDASDALLAEREKGGKV